MTKFVLLWICAWLFTGEPAAWTIRVPDGVACDAALATATARMRTAETGPIQDEVLWKCETVTSPGPAPMPEAPPLAGKLDG